MTIARSLLGLCALGLAACAAPGDPPSGAPAPSATLSGTRWIGVVDPSADPIAELCRGQVVRIGDHQPERWCPEFGGNSRRSFR